MWRVSMSRPKSGSMLLYSRKKVRYRRDGYCWKKRKDGKTTREDHMKLKVQGTECIYGCYVHSAILPTFHRRCYWLLQVRETQLLWLEFLSTTLPIYILYIFIYNNTPYIYYIYLYTTILPMVSKNQNPDIVLVHYLNVPFSDDNKLMAPMLSAFVESKKEWTKEELISELKPMCK